MKKAFPFYKQPDSKDCGPTCLRIIAKHYGKLISLQDIRDLSETTRAGSNLLKLSDAAESIGFKSLGVKIDFNKLKDAPLPIIVHWNKNHFVVVYKIKKDVVYISDPSYGLITYTKDEFIPRWMGNNATEDTKEGIALLLEVTPKFKHLNWEETDKKSFRFLFQYLFKYKNLLIQLIIGLVVGSMLQLIFPFLTQSIVDVGIQNQDIDFIYMVLIAQVMLFLGQTSVGIFRSWILLHLSTRINISLVSDFFIKLMNLPIAYFDTRMTGDIMQRINDHSRIESLLTGSTLNTLFSMVNLFVFGAVLIYYSTSIFFIFAIGSIIYVLWILFFLKRRKELDYKRFSQMSQEQSTVIELINGMQEIKMNNAEKQKRWKWEYVQARLFKVSMQSLALEQTQGVGSSFINQAKNIFITFTSALLVIEGNITLGMMLSIQYIIGQLNGPIGQLVGFIQATQDAKISLERLGEIHDREDEESKEKHLISNIKPDQDLELNDITFRYLGSDENVIKGITMNIPANKITAIVGASGSGKTTLMKILLKFYDTEKGNIMYGEHYLNAISHKTWRANCGVVMQEGYVFNDTIAYNIAVGEDTIDQERLIQATKVANIYEFIQSLPLGFNTKIGNEGVGVSTGQKQRLFIARAVYKNPDVLFFDEATSALDSKNENVIMQNLNKFFKDKTVIIIAHRLSTVKNADQIVVIDDGKVKESGKHRELLDKQGVYYNLVKNQLELEKLSSEKKMPKSKYEDNLNLRSEEVQEILTNPPAWIVRWGITLIFMFVCIILTLSFMIKYPDFVTAKVLVTTKQPTEKVISRYSGQLDKIFIKNRDTVAVNQKLAIIKNTANFEDVYLLKQIIDTIPFNIKNFQFPFEKTSHLILGDISTAHINFEKSYTDYFLLKDLDPYTNQLGGNKVALQEIKNRLRNQIIQKQLLEQEFMLKQTDLDRSKQLYEKGVIAKQAYEQKQIEFIQMQKNISSMAISISQMREAISSASRNLKTTRIKEQEDNTRFLRNLTQSYDLLKEAIRNWEYNYVLKSSINGVVSFQDFWGKHQFVNSGSIVFSILPTDTSNLVGKLVIPAQNAGKVSVGQKVFIKLDNYPYQQYGVIIGKVENFSISPNDEGNYTVFVSLPNGTQTSYNKTFKFTQELLGNAEIITEDLSVAERLFYKFREVLTYN